MLPQMHQLEMVSVLSNKDLNSRLAGAKTTLCILKCTFPMKMVQSQKDCSFQRVYNKSSNSSHNWEAPTGLLLPWSPHCFYKAQIMKRKWILVAFLSTRQKEKSKKMTFQFTRFSSLQCFNSLVTARSSF